jgi:hypothetical protein
MNGEALGTMAFAKTELMSRYFNHICHANDRTTRGTSLIRLYHETAYGFILCAARLLLPLAALQTSLGAWRVRRVEENDASTVASSRAGGSLVQVDRPRTPASHRSSLASAQARLHQIAGRALHIELLNRIEHLVKPCRAR